VARAQVDAFKKALGADRIDVGAYPSTEEGLAALMNKPSNPTQALKWNGPYLDGVLPVDPGADPIVTQALVPRAISICSRTARMGKSAVPVMPPMCRFSCLMPYAV